MNMRIPQKANKTKERLDDPCSSNEAMYPNIPDAFFDIARGSFPFACEIEE